MDKKAIYNLSYGVFMLSTRSGEKVNGCITNTCMQVAGILDHTCSFATIKHFGFQSGRDVDKFADLQMPKDCNDIPYMGWNACAVISGKVVEQHDLGTHTLFIAEVVDAKLINENAPLTYADYQTKVKPKAEPKAQDKKIVGWRCRICNCVYEGSELPADFTCPICGHGVEDFEPVYEA